MSAKDVTPAERAKLKGILAHYAGKPHPFTACVRDNRKRFGPRTEAVCAVVKDLIVGHTHWRGKKAADGEEAWEFEFEPRPDELTRTDWEAIGLLLAEGDDILKDAGVYTTADYEGAKPVDGPAGTKKKCKAHNKMGCKDCVTKNYERDDDEYTVTKAHDEMRYTLGVLYAPDAIDAHDEFTTDTELHKAVHEYVRNGDLRLRDQHDRRKIIGDVVEIVRWPTEATFTVTVPSQEGLTKEAREVKMPAGTVYVGVVWSDEAWAEIKNGKKTGFSLGGKALRVRGLEKELPRMSGLAKRVDPTTGNQPGKTYDPNHQRLAAQGRAGRRRDAKANADFEAKHPRGPGGRFGTKPKGQTAGAKDKPAGQLNDRNRDGSNRDDILARGLAWGGKTFKDRASFEKWLEQHGSSWAEFKAKHPDAADALEDRSRGITSANDPDAEHNQLSPKMRELKEGEFKLKERALNDRLEMDRLQGERDRLKFELDGTADEGRRRELKAKIRETEAKALEVKMRERTTRGEQERNKLEQEREQILGEEQRRRGRKTALLDHAVRTAGSKKPGGRTIQAVGGGPVHDGGDEPPPKIRDADPKMWERTPKKPKDDDDDPERGVADARERLGQSMRDLVDSASRAAARRVGEPTRKPGRKMSVKEWNDLDDDEKLERIRGGDKPKVPAGHVMFEDGSIGRKKPDRRRSTQRAE